MTVSDRRANISNIYPWNNPIRSNCIHSAVILSSPKNRVTSRLHMASIYAYCDSYVNEWGRSRIPIDSRFIIRRVRLWGKTILDCERSDECNDFTMIYAFNFFSCLKAFFLWKKCSDHQCRGKFLVVNWIYTVDNLVGQIGRHFSIYLLK